MRKEILTDEKIKLDIPYSRAQDWGDVTDKFLRFFLPFTALGIILILATTWKLALPCFAVSAGVLIWYILMLNDTHEIACVHNTKLFDYKTELS